MLGKGLCGAFSPLFAFPFGFFFRYLISSPQNKGKGKKKQNIILLAGWPVRLYSVLGTYNGHSDMGAGSSVPSTARGSEPVRS